MPGWLRLSVCDKRYIRGEWGTPTLKTRDVGNYDGGRGKALSLGPYYLCSAIPRPVELIGVGDWRLVVLVKVD